MHLEEKKKLEERKKTLQDEMNAFEKKKQEVDKNFGNSIISQNSFKFLHSYTFAVPHSNEVNYSDVCLTKAAINE